MKSDFDDLDFGLNFDTFQENTIDGIVFRMLTKKRSFFNIKKEVKQIQALINEPPHANEVFKFLSCGGFSSLAFIKYIASQEKIIELFISTFRIGKKQFGVLCDLNDGGGCDKVHFITSSTQAKIDALAEYNGKKYNYYEYIVNECVLRDWKLTVFDNHSKLILMQTQKNWYVLETSSNLNENPKMEQFSFENDKALFNWYKQLFLEIEKNA